MDDWYTVSYRLVAPGIVEIDDGIIPPTPMDEGSIRYAIANVERNKADYVSETAYHHQLLKYQEALKFLQDQEDG